MLIPYLLDKPKWYIGTKSISTLRYKKIHLLTQDPHKQYTFTNKKGPFWPDQPFPLQYKDKNGDISLSLLLLK